MSVSAPRNGLLVHEWIEGFGGAEKVLDALVAGFSDADVFCLWNDAPDRYPGRRVRESSLASTALRGRKALSLPVLPGVWRRDLRNGPQYDWSIVSSHLFAHHVRIPGVAPERQFTYVHTPARYLWNPELDERGATAAVRVVAPVFRSVDRAASKRLRHVAANSAFVRDRIRRAWNVDATVIHPPVEVDRLRSVSDWSLVLDDGDRAVLDSLPSDFVLGASRFVPYKRLDLVIAAGEASGRPVVIAGSGPDEPTLRERAARSSAEVRFVIRPSDALLAAMMQRAAVFVFPPVEDFGIMPVEAMALGTPVVANSIGGARDSVDERTGVLVPDFEVSTLRAAVDRAASLPSDDCRTRSAQFSAGRFLEHVRSWVAPQL